MDPIRDEFLRKGHSSGFFYSREEKQWIGYRTWWNEKEQKREFKSWKAISQAEDEDDENENKK